MSSSRNSNDENLKADIVIIGGGGAGLPAAVAAAEAGAKNIVVLEKAAKPGGNARLCVCFFAVESPLQKRLGINVAKDEVFKQHMDYGHWKNDARLVRTWINKSGELARWLEEKGVEFDSVIAFSTGHPRVTLTCSKGRRAGIRILETLVKNCQDLGVQMLCETAASKILTDGDGKVTGVLATIKDKEFKITAKSIIIAAGSFSSNKKLLKKYFPSYSKDVFTHSVPGMMGDGLRMAKEVGAALEEEITFIEFGPHHYPWNRHITLLVRRPDVIWVNKNGERYVDESVSFNRAEGANALSRQPDNISYTLLDTKIKQAFIKKDRPTSGMEDMLGDGTAWLNELENDIQSEIDKGRIKKSDSWNEIAEWIGATPAVLKDTIDQYNSFCDAGYDADFLKDKVHLLPLRMPPYYAILARQGFDVSMGGIRINHRMEVLNKHGNPISGLYAVGNNAGGYESDCYDVNLPGSSYGFALCSGYIAGENAAKYVLEGQKVKR